MLFNCFKILKHFFLASQKYETTHGKCEYEGNNQNINEVFITFQWSTCVVTMPIQYLMENGNC